jgi:outer membrane protein assembly factor BamB
MRTRTSRLLRRIAQAAGGGAVALALAGCWPVPGQNANRTGYNPSETGITADNVAELVEKWTATGNGPVGSPVVSKGGVHVVRPPCHIFTVAPATGAVRWSATTTYLVPQGCNVTAQTDPGEPFVVGDSVYVGTEVRGTDPIGCSAITRGLDVVSGTITSDWSSGALAAFRNLEDFPDLIAATDCVGDPETQGYKRFGTLGRLADGFMYDVRIPGGFAQTTIGAAGDLFHAGPGILATQPGDPATGNGIRGYTIGFYPNPVCGPAGDESCPHWAVPTDGAVLGHPIVDGVVETVYAGTDAGTVYAIEGTSGSTRWTASVGAPLAAAPALAPRPGASSKALYVPTTDGRLVVLDASTGEQLWTAVTGTGSAIQVQPAVAGGVVYTGSADGGVHAFAAAGCDAPTCDPLWSAATGSAITGAPAVSRQLYVGTADGRLIAFGLT